MIGLALGFWMAVSVDHEAVSAVRGMGSRSFRQRESATLKLVEMGERSVPYLLAASSSPDLEVRRRAEIVFEVYVNKILPTDKNRLPCLDALPGDYGRKEAVWGKYTKLYGDPDNQYEFDWVAFESATRDHVKDLVLEGASRREIVQLLDLMVPIEEEIIKSNKRRMSYPR